MDDALQAYGFGWTDGTTDRNDPNLADNPDYLVGLVDGQLAVFEETLIAAVREALGDPA